MSYIVLAIPVFFLLIALELAITRAPGEGLLLARRLRQRPRLRAPPAARRGLPEDGPLRRLPLPLRAPPAVRRSPTRSVGGLGGLLPRRGLPLLLVPPQEPRGERVLGRARRPPPERGVQPRGGAAPGRLPGRVLLGLLPARWRSLGFPPLMFLTVSSINTLYQFWIHTRAIGRLGPLEWVLNTPSNHRVHHGRNPKYIDRNHGGIAHRLGPPVRHLRARRRRSRSTASPRRSRSWNPVWANLHYWVDLGGQARRAARPSDKLRLFLKPPGWQPADLGGFQPPPEVDRGHDRTVRDARFRRAAGLRARPVPDRAGARHRVPGPPGLLVAGGALDGRAAFVMVSLVACGGLLERQALGGPAGDRRGSRRRCRWSTPAALVHGLVATGDSGRGGRGGDVAAWLLRVTKCGHMAAGVATNQGGALRRAPLS